MTSRGGRYFHRFSSACCLIEYISSIPKNTVEERTKINLSEISLTRKTITSNHDSDDNSTDNEKIEQTFHNNPEESINQFMNNEMVLPNN